MKVSNTTDAVLMYTNPGKVTLSIPKGDYEIVIGQVSKINRDNSQVWSLEDLKAWAAKPEIQNRIAMGSLRFPDLKALRETLGYAGEIPSATQAQVEYAVAVAVEKTKAETADSQRQEIETFKAKLQAEHDQAVSAVRAEHDQAMSMVKAMLEELKASRNAPPKPEKAKGKVKAGGQA